MYTASKRMEQFEEMKLTNLDIDCLERIFQYLAVPDLMNVADSNKHLKNAADLTFLLKHGRRTVHIDGLYSDTSELNHCVFKDKFIFVYLKGALQLLRCFGHVLSKLKIDIRHCYMNNIELLRAPFDHLISYVKEYCTESLIELKIVGLPGGALNKFVKPFPNVQSVCVQSFDLTNVSLIELFPKMQRLTYHCYQTTDRELRLIEKYFPNLKHIEIRSENSWELECLRIIDNSWEESIVRIIKLNPELQGLSLPLILISNSKSMVLQQINEILPYLQDLTLNRMHISQEHSITYHLKTVKRLELHYRVQFSRIPLSFDKLEELNLKFNDSNVLRYKHDQFYNFIRDNPSISKLTIQYDQEISMSKLINILPSPREVDLDGSDIPISELVKFMNKKKTLKKIITNVPNSWKWKTADLNVHLNQLLDDKWHGKRKFEPHGPFIFSRA